MGDFFNPRELPNISAADADAFSAWLVSVGESDKTGMKAQICERLRAVPVGPRNSIESIMPSNFLPGREQKEDAEVSTWLSCAEWMHQVLSHAPFVSAFHVKALLTVASLSAGDLDEEYKSAKAEWSKALPATVFATLSRLEDLLVTGKDHVMIASFERFADGRSVWLCTYGKCGLRSVTPGLSPIVALPEPEESGQSDSDAT